MRSMVALDAWDLRIVTSCGFPAVVKAEDITKSNLGEYKETKADMGAIFSLTYEEYETSRRELLMALAELPTLG